MQIRLFALSAAFVACSNSAGAVSLPTHETYSAAADFGGNFFSSEPYISQSSITSIPSEIASIPQSTGIGIPLINNYFAAASTNFGSNHAYARASALPLGSIGITSFSGWYDQVTITGGTGTGTVQFTTHFSGIVDVGQFAGGAASGLFASTLHPTQLVDTTLIVDPVSTRPWALDAPLGMGDNPELTTITGYVIGASPYNDPNILFTTTKPSSLSETVIGLPVEPHKTFANIVLTPGSEQIVDIVLTGTLTFTYGETFYLIGGLGTGVADGLDPSCVFAIEGTCTPTPKDGTGATTLDFSNSANLINIALPYGATANFTSGASYNVTTVPEPGEWLMLLTGLGLVSWAARRRA